MDLSAEPPATKVRRLGDTGLEVSPLSFGAMLIGADPDLRNGVSPALLTALESGVRLIDTARIYSGSEDIIGATLKVWTGEKPLISSKIAPLSARTFRHYQPIQTAFTPISMRQSVEASLRALQVETIDLIHLHQWFYLWSFESEWRAALADLQQEGKVRFVAVSAQDHEHDALLEVVRNGAVDAVQFIYNVFESRPRTSLLPMAARHGVGAIARCVLDSGALTGLMDEAAFAAHHFLKGADYAAYERRLCALRDAFVDSAVESLDELALRFAISDPRISTITLGLKTAAEVHRATDIIARGPLPDSVLDQIVTHHVWTKNAYERLV